MTKTEKEREKINIGTETKKNLPKIYLNPCHEYMKQRFSYVLSCIVSTSHKKITKPV